MNPFEHEKYYAKKSFWKLFGGEIRIYSPDQQNLLFYVKQKAFKLKEDITVYSDESKQQPLLSIKARSVIDFSAAYDIVDSSTQEKVGTLRRKGFKSIFKDSWQILDLTDNEVGKISEDSTGMALLRRFLTNLIPQTFNIILGEEKVGQLKQKFNPFVPQFDVDFSVDTAKRLDRRLGIGIIILLQVIEGRQK